MTAPARAHAHISGRPTPSRRRRPTTAALTLLALLTTSLGTALPARADVEPVAVVAPDDLVVGGIARVGETVEVDPRVDEWVPDDVTLTFRWLAGGAEIPGAEAPAYTITPADLGEVLTVEVTGTAGDGASATAHGVAGTVVAGVLSAGTPTVSGTARVGSTLTARPGVWSPSPTFSYQWQRRVGTGAWTSIPNATTATYALVAADRDARVRVRVTGSTPGYTSVERTSAQTALVAAGALSSVVPTVSGTARVGSRLTAKPGSWTAGTTLTYQWRVGGKNVAGATTSTFTPRAADKGKTVTVVVKGTKGGYTTKSVTSKATKAVANGVFTTAPAPKITGTARVGSTLKVSTGTWSPKPTLTYQWKANGKNIKGATKSSYKLAAADHGKKITVTVTAKRTAYTTKAVTSKATAAVTKPFTKTATPKITGTARVGSTLKASVGTWSPKPTYSYQWKRNGTAIKGATKSSYKLTAADHGKQITVTVTAKRTAYVTASRTSAKTTKVLGPAAVLTKNGTFQVGRDIKPGTYVGSGGYGCYWERRSSAGSSFSGIISNDFITAGRTIVTIRSTDKYFKTSDCGSWTPLTKLSTPKTTMGDGTHAVGIHIQPGTYRAPGGYGCYWETTSGFSGSLNDIIDNDFTYGGQQYVTIASSVKGFSTYDCGTWKRVSS